MLTLMLASLLGCNGDADPVDTTVDACGPGGDSYTFVMTGMYYTRKDDNGQTLGFDLDDHVSDAGDDEGCFKEDAVDPYGNEGIDNQFSVLIPALEAVEPEVSAVEGLILDSINAGDLLLLFEVSGVHDMDNDECVSVSVFRGEGAPLIGTDGKLLDHQSFSRSDLPPNSTVEQASIVDGAVEVRGLELVLPLMILDVELEFNIDEAAARLMFDDDGSLSGYFGGGVPLEDILVIADEEDLGATADLIRSVVPTFADLFPDAGGQCQELSVAFEMDGVPAFFYGE